MEIDKILDAFKTFKTCIVKKKQKLVILKIINSTVSWRWDLYSLFWCKYDDMGYWLRKKYIYKLKCFGYLVDIN